jgi:NADPH-dependent curcumin reductase CurA
VGDTMRAFSVGDVVESRNPAYAVGDKVMGIFGWQDYAAVKQPQVMRKVLEDDLPLSLSLGVLGLNGLTAYFGLLDVCRPKAGETIVVSTAAGGVGSAVGQIAKIRGCRAVGFAGGPEKVRQCVDDFGYDAAIDYKAEASLDGALARHCPQGIDAFFDNTSGAVHDVVLRRINLGARIAICGTASYASWDPWNEGPRPERHLLVKRAIMQGFLTTDFAARYEEAVAALAGWIREEKLKYREDILQGIEAAPASIAMLYAGENRGKLIIKL